MGSKDRTQVVMLAVSALPTELSSRPLIFLFLCCYFTSRRLSLSSNFPNSPTDCSQRSHVLFSHLLERFPFCGADCRPSCGTRSSAMTWECQPERAYCSFIIRREEFTRHREEVTVLMTSKGHFISFFLRQETCVCRK